MRLAMNYKNLIAMAIMLGFLSTSFAQQFDAPYYELEKKHGAECPSSSKWNR